MTDEQIWRIIAKHYQGSINPPSLLAQKIFAVAQEIRQEAENTIDLKYRDLYDRLIDELNTEIWNQACEIAHLKGEPPPQPIATAANGIVRDFDPLRVLGQ